MLDYIFTDEEKFIENMKVGQPLGKSDHIVLEWDVILKMSEIDSKLTKRNFWKGDYNKMIKNLQAVNWKEQFDGKSVEDMWIYLKSELLKQIEEHIPLRVDRKPRKKDYISRATKKHMKKCSKAWKRYRQFRSGKNYED